MQHYWKSLEEREHGALAEGEFPENPLQTPAGRNRRGFLKAAGFSFASAVLAGCRRAPVGKAAPNLVQPEGILPGRAVYYASTCTACPAGCGLLVKTRDGRPIKLEGNPEHPVSRGGLCAVGQASILGLYDSLRLKQPLAGGKAVTWDQADRAILARLDSLRSLPGAVRFLTGTITSPTVAWAIGQFLKGFREAQHIQYDALSSSAILDAHQRTHGVRVLPRYRFEKAEVIVSFDADFLGAWISPVEFTAGYSAARNPELTTPPLAWHAQIESRMSLTGSKADRRIIAAPDEIDGLVARLAGEIESGRPEGELARRLLAARGRSLVLSASQDPATQALVNQINHRLGNYGATIDLDQPSYQRRGNDRDAENLLREADAGKIAALFVAGANPVYDLPGGEAVRKVPLVVSFAERLDETAAIAHYVCPDRHALESWGDAEPVSGVTGILQPVIQPLGGTRQLVETLAVWAGAPRPACEIVRERWREQHPDDFENFWEATLERGFAAREPKQPQARAFVSPQPPRQNTSQAGWSLVLYPTPGMLDGRHAYNPWLHELPDPITKVTWDNYASLAPGAAGKLGITDGDVIRVAGLELPAVIQPGQHERTVAVALGYGSRLSERFAQAGPEWIEALPTLGPNGRIGWNAAPLARFENGSLRYVRAGVEPVKTGRRWELARTQDHHSLGSPRRPIIQEISPEEFATARPAGDPREELWPPDHPFTGHRWAMTVDLNACTGCSACVIACQVENNTPVVGKDEVRRKREMHWMRIDRYYSGPPEAPEVAHQPMFCQQCEHAGCETVCPVLATVHSEEGLNQQVYNRCVGTRYCANNCAYKARRFNWFEYARQDRLANLVLNPDVTVRSRGVMEKCTFCVQRIQEAKMEARRLGRAVRDGEVQTACQQSCPAGAIVFGDLNDPKSRVAQLMRSGRRYRVLEEINSRPSVGYLKVVRRRGGQRHG